MNSAELPIGPAPAPESIPHKKGFSPQRSPAPGFPSAPFNQNPDGGQVFYDDPLRQLLSEKNIKVLGEAEDSLPVEVTEFLIDNQLEGKTFQVLLKQVPEGANEGANATAFVKSWYKTVPSLEYIARHFGPGQYSLFITYRVYEDDGSGKKVQKSKAETIPISISEKYETEHIEFMRSEKIRLARKAQEKVRDMKADKQIDAVIFQDMPELRSGEEKDAKTTAREYIKEITSVAQDLGLSRQQGGGLMESLAPFAPVIGTAIMGFLKMQSDMAQQQQTQMNQFMMLMMAQGEKSTNNLIEMMKIQSGQGAGKNAMTEYTEMLKSAVDIKEFLAGGKQTVSDRIFGVIEGVLPQILTLASMPKAQRAPMEGMARTFVQSNPDFSAAMKDPALMADVIRKLDSHYGWRQTDGILTVAGIERPDVCPRDPRQELPVDDRPIEGETEVINEQSGQSGNS